MCRFSVGIIDPLQPDATQFAKFLEKINSDNPEKFWINIKNFEATGLGNEIQQRIDQAIRLGCDGIIPEDLNAYQYSNEFKNPIDLDDQIKYIEFVAGYSHFKNLSVGLNNNFEIADKIIEYFDIAFCDQDLIKNQCNHLDKFISQNKAVFGISYSQDLQNKNQTIPNFCNIQIKNQYSWVIKNKNTFLTEYPC